LSKTDVICSDCRTKVDAVFNAATGTRDLVLINGMQEREECCFVADEIVFNGDSQLVFKPHIFRERPQYCPEYFVVCRKLTISGGREAKDVLNPCGPEDPGHMYSSNNVITWKDRLLPAAEGAPYTGPPNGPPPKATKGTSHDRDTWSEVGQKSNNGANGGDGVPGLPGRDGANGFQPTPNVTVLALEVEISATGHLNIDFDGQNGGRGGKGQEGGDGGDGMGGRAGHTEDNAWPGSDECDQQPGDGGDGGNGGPGGPGGRGGTGGRGGAITIISTPANIASSGVFVGGGHIHYINDGGDGGKGGKGGRSGVGGKAGKQGRPKTELCEEPDPGAPGEPTSALGAVDAPDGPLGTHGGNGPLAFEPVHTGTCADLIPFPPMTVTSVTPATGAQGTTVRVAIAGVGFNPTAPGFGVDVGGIGVSAAIVASPPAPPHTSTLTTWDFTIGGLAPKTGRKVTVKNSLANKADLDPGFTVT
jgi:hypothetical protein